MKKIILILVLFIIGIGVFIYIYKPAPVEEDIIPTEISLTTQNMNITSTAFENNGNIPSKYTCDGDNISPPLQISEIPENTKSIIMIVDDPDAPAGTWVHWLLWNISPDITEIAENSIPQGATEGTTSFGNTGYGGPCPPSGTHRYFFKIYALDNTLDIGPEAKAEDLNQAMQGHIIESAEIIGLYSRG